MALPTPYGRFKHYRLHPHALGEEAIQAILLQLAAEPGFSLQFQAEALARLSEQFPDLDGFLGAALHPECNVFLMQHRLFWDPVPLRWHSASMLGMHWPQIRAPRLLAVLNLSLRTALGLSVRDEHRTVAVMQLRPGAITTIRGHLTIHATGQAENPDAPHGLILEQHRLTPRQRQNLPPWCRL